ncbi:mCG142635, partial [Mus musculus]
KSNLQFPGEEGLLSLNLCCLITFQSAHAYTAPDHSPAPGEVRTVTQAGVEPKGLSL